MRVIAGSARSIKLRTLEGQDTRPTQDRIKETLFNILQSDVPGAIFVDAYSGSGAIGIEALSRGAAKAYLIENNRKACEMIRDNLLVTKLADRAEIKMQDVPSCFRTLGEEHIDLIFLDPPYHQDMEKRALEVLREMPYVNEETQIIVEAALNTSFEYAGELGFMIVKEKKYKTNQHVFLRRKRIK